MHFVFPMVSIPSTRCVRIYFIRTICSCLIFLVRRRSACAFPAPPPYLKSVVLCFVASPFILKKPFTINFPFKCVTATTQMIFASRYSTLGHQNKTTRYWWYSCMIVRKAQSKAGWWQASLKSVGYFFGLRTTIYTFQVFGADISTTTSISSVRY